MVAPNFSFDPLVIALRDYAPVVTGLELNLEAAIHQATSEPGKLVRARLAEAGAQANTLDEAEARQLACGIEYFHTASLLLDDLPCMDDASMRRGHPCVHRTYGDATAILAALALINRAYTLLNFAFAHQPAAVRLRAHACVDACLGPAGLVGGQAADLRFSEGPKHAHSVSRIASAKTGSLFWLAVFLPALPGGATSAELHKIKALCIYWGLAFQALDDLSDLIRSSKEAGKSSGRDEMLTRPNLALAIGIPATRARVSRLANLAGRMVLQLEQASPKWSYLRKFQDEHFETALRGAESALAAA